MLEGKPAGENDQVTMNAIKSILSDYEHEFDGGQIPSRSPDRTQGQTKRSATAAAPSNLQPVEEVAVKLQGVHLEQAVAQMGKTARQRQPRKRRKLRISVPLRTVSGWGLRVLGAVTPGRAALVVLTGYVLVAPRLIGLVAVTALVLLLAAFVLFGADRVWETVFARLARYKARAPQRADRLAMRLSVLASHWDSVLDRFPDGSVDRLYMPDFANYEAEQAAREQTVCARLDKMHRQV